jgi:hypothetical protein
LREQASDVHARSVVGCAIDGETGEVFRRRLTPDFGEILAWIRSLPGPVKSVYEAGPTGFENVRAEVMRARHRISKLLLRHGLVYSAES